MKTIRDAEGLAEAEWVVPVESIRDAEGVAVLSGSGSQRLDRRFGGGGGSES